MYGSLCLHYQSKTKTIFMNKRIQIQTCYGIMLLSCIFLLGVSCKKNNPGLPSISSSSYYVRFKANGIQKEYTLTWAKLDQLLFANTYTSYVTGGNLNDTTKNSLSFRIYYNNAVSANTVYSEKMYDPMVMPEAYFVFVDDKGNSHTSFKNTLEPILDFNIQFTEITLSYVKGVFNGTTKSVNNNQIMTITDGEFYVVRP